MTGRDQSSCARCVPEEGARRAGSVAVAIAWIDVAGEVASLIYTGGKP